MTFERFASAHGLMIRDLYADGRVHRCPTADHPRTRNGAYKFTGEWGWVQNWAEHAEPVIWRAEGVSESVVRRDMAAERKRDEERRRKAAVAAQEIVSRCRFDRHPYLERKGFKDEQGLVDYDGRLVIPMRAITDYGRVNSVQWISSEGEKKFLPGGTAKASAFVIGSGPEAWLCEGFATGLSVRAGLQRLYRPARVVVCFSAGNIAAVAARLSGVRFVVADNDASGTGARYAEQTGLSWVMPPEVGTDANDYHQSAGAMALAKLLRTVIQR